MTKKPHKNPQFPSNKRAYFATEQPSRSKKKNMNRVKQELKNEIINNMRFRRKLVILKWEIEEKNIIIKTNK